MCVCVCVCARARARALDLNRNSFTHRASWSTISASTSYCLWCNTRAGRYICIRVYTHTKAEDASSMTTGGAIANTT